MFDLKLESSENRLLHIDSDTHSDGMYAGQSETNDNDGESALIANKNEISLTVNGRKVSVDAGGHRVLLQLLREELKLTGTKYGCGEGQCGACTVLLDGRAVRSCITPVSRVANKSVTTIEGLAGEGKLHPVQKVFLEEGAVQCGYCVPGMVLAAAAFLEKNPDPDKHEIIEAMNGNVCRCCNYVRIVAAVRRAAELLKQGE